MTRPDVRQTDKNTNTKRRATLLAVIIVLQALCALFFAGDVIFDLREGGHLDDIHLIAEAVAAVVLSAGTVVLMLELRRLLSRMREMNVGLKAARGEMASLVEQTFSEWQLTPSEREIALFILKGLDNESIARLRNTAQGTVRAQSAGIYAKAQVDGRAQFLSVFMEELFAFDGDGLKS